MGIKTNMIILASVAIFVLKISLENFYGNKDGPKKEISTTYIK